VHGNAVFYVRPEATDESLKAAGYDSIIGRRAKNLGKTPITGFPETECAIHDSRLAYAKYVITLEEF
jgi:hypothetical protein